MGNEDTILIKIGVSYKEGMTPEELYHATSVSWVVSESRLRTGDLKFYCAVYNNEIKEVYSLDGYEMDKHPDNKGRFILVGKIAEEPIRSKLLNVNVQDIHRGSGNPIKYVKMEELLSRAPIEIYDKNEDTSAHSMVREDDFPILSLNEIIDHIDLYIASKGFYYPKEEVINLFLSLKTKPFVILSGISGTGKTKMVQWFAESLGANEKNGQFTLIPVRPDWSDGSDLLGYVDIKGDFKEGPLTKAIKAAQEQPDLPYFVLLDEMNLARVEYYFSDILSVMESRRWEDGKVVSSVLLSEEVAKEEVTLPDNLYVIGTVNMDETTHPFSKKVLDRANTIEFNRVELDNLSFLQDLDGVDPLEVGQTQLASKYLHLKDLYKVDAEIIEKATSELVRINKSLQLINAHIGYRVRDEVCFYLAYNKEGNLMNFEEAFDHCILQKILPRLSGSDSRIDQLLRELYLIFTNAEYQEDGESQFDEESAIYPKSARKVMEMLRRLKDDGFTSFWIS
ncbi:AAA family ATPase [Bacillus infantis]|uniref:McrB family protein n=1 Tax=Bacillus infantis TaxID=324767 RepID=UPI001CD1FA63|nr:AAA family ATPase [Bacillus infantis]MCA1035703.1 AAA family ATPase [Bacillus infantis]